jgi:hypothetical protein
MYLALASFFEEVLFLRQLLPTVGCPLIDPTKTFEDNTSRIALATNKTKHIDTKYHFTRSLIKAGAISITWCPTHDMIADILTKISLPTSAHLKHARCMLNGTFSGPGLI